MADVAEHSQILQPMPPPSANRQEVMQMQVHAIHIGLPALGTASPIAQHDRSSPPSPVRRVSIAESMRWLEDLQPGRERLCAKTSRYVVRTIEVKPPDHELHASDAPAL